MIKFKLDPEIHLKFLSNINNRNCDYQIFLWGVS